MAHVAAAEKQKQDMAARNEELRWVILLQPHTLRCGALAGMMFAAGASAHMPKDHPPKPVHSPDEETCTQPLAVPVITQQHVRLTGCQMGNRAALQGKARELEGQRSIVQQHEKHETEVAHERDVLSKQHVRAEGAVQKQVPVGLISTLTCSGK